MQMTGPGRRREQLVGQPGDADLGRYQPRVAGGRQRENPRRSIRALRAADEFTTNPFDDVLSLSNVKRIGVSPRVGRIGLPHDAPAQGGRCELRGPISTPNRAGFAGLKFAAHTWYFHDSVFLEDVLHTIRGDVDRSEIVTRAGMPGALALRRAVV